MPSAVVVTDFALHRQWLHPGNDLYLCLAGQLAEQARRSVGRRAAASGPLVAERFTRPSSSGGAARWRRRLGAAGRPAVLLSTGAWGAVNGAAETAALLAGTGYLPVVLCGRNTRLRRGLSAVPDAIALGWVEDMPGLMAAAAVLIDNAAGQTALEAMAAGLPVLSYRPIPGHGLEGARCMAGLGLSQYARDPAALLRSIQAVSSPGPVRQRRVAPCSRPRASARCRPRPPTPGGSAAPMRSTTETTARVLRGAACPPFRPAAGCS